MRLIALLLLGSCLPLAALAARPDRLPDRLPDRGPDRVHDRVLICHVVPGARRVITLEIDAAAEPAHLAHGDFEPMAGSCALADSYVPCGGFANIECPADATCLDIPDDACEPDCGGADCAGMCVAVRTGPVPCAGPDDLDCPADLICFDDPADTCSIDCGDADCAGICVSPLRRM